MEEKVDVEEFVREMAGDKDDAGVVDPDDLVDPPNIESKDATLADASSSV